MRPLWTCGPRARRLEAARDLARDLGLGGAFECLEPDPFGRPRATAGGRPLALSFSHCGPWTAVACAARGRVGIDLVEATTLQASPWTDLIPPMERRAWEGVPEADRPLRALQAWACREALLKALGLGLRLDPDDLLLDPREEGFGIRRLPAGLPGDWNLELFPAREGAPGLWVALAWSRGLAAS